MSVETALQLIDRAVALEPGQWPYQRLLCELSARALHSLPDQAGYFVIKARLGEAVNRCDYFKAPTAAYLVESLRDIRRELETINDKAR